MKRIEQKEQTRLHLLSKAYSKFAETGFLSTKTLDIATAAGVSHGTLFVHFPTKEELLTQAIDEFGMRMGMKLMQLTKDKESTREVLRAHLETLEEYEPFYAHLVIEGPLLPRSVRNRIFAIQSGIAHYLEKTIQRKEGSTPIHFVLNSWIGLIHYYLANRDIFAPGKSVIAVCGKDFLNHFINTFHL